MVPFPCPMTGKLLLEIYQRLYARFGPQGWWPADTPFEVFVGAILTQNTAWSNVEKAIGNLKAHGLMDPFALAGADVGTLEALLRPAGYYRVKAQRLKEAVRFLCVEFSGDMAKMAQVPLEEIRPRLLQVKGIGPETADSILLYACEKPIFVVDAYTRRILGRHGIVDPKVPYEALQRVFMENLPRDVDLFKEYHALLVKLGKTLCRPKPRCQGCPLEGIGSERAVAGQEGKEARRQGHL